MECPVAVDAEGGVVYYYHCAGWGDRRDASEIRRVDLNSGRQETIFHLGLNKWALWLCRYLPQRTTIATLVATEMPRRADGGVVIQHQLGLFDPQERRSLLVSLPRDCFSPLDVDAGRERVLFYGVEGYQIVDFTGRRLWKLGPRGLPEGRGGNFHPEIDGRVALGGSGVVIIDRNGAHQVVRECGLNPVWSQDGSGLFFAESSSDLWRWDAASGHAERLLAVAGNRFAEVNRARPVQISADGRLLALPITRRIRREPLEGAVGPDNGPAWVEWSAICVVDLAEKCVWQTPGSGPVCWA